MHKFRGFWRAPLCVDPIRITLTSTTADHNSPIRRNAGSYEFEPRWSPGPVRRGQTEFLFLLVSLFQAIFFSLLSGVNAFWDARSQQETITCQSSARRGACLAFGAAPPSVLNFHYCRKNSVLNGVSYNGIG